MPSPNGVKPQRTFATACSNRNLITTLEDPSILDNRVMHLGFKHLKEAILADLTARLWTFDDGFGGAAQGTQSRRHAELDERRSGS